MSKVKISLVPVCLCGCGEPVTKITKTSVRLGRVKGEFNKYVCGHNKNREGTVHSKKSIERMRNAHTGFKHTTQTKEKIRIIAFDKGYGKWMRGKVVSEDLRLKISRSMMGKNKGKKTEVSKLKMSASKIKLWKTDEYVSKQMKAHRVKQNKKELLLEKILHDLYPNEWKFVGDGQVIIDGKCPDFINVNGQKKIIELFGDYWHKGENPQDRIDVFKPFGYDTLVIWEKDLKDMIYTKMLINHFVRNHE